MIWLLVVAGGLGAVLRFLLDDLVGRLVTSRFPLGTLLVNLSGSFALGLVVGNFGTDSPAALVLGTGLLGGFTTFSTHAVETLRLVLIDGRWRAAVLNVGLTAASCLGAGAVGLWLAG